MTSSADEVILEASEVIASDRLYKLLDRDIAFLAARDRWEQAGIWVIGHEDENYPSRIRQLLGAKAPPVLFGFGETTLTDEGGLAVVGSRSADAQLIQYAQGVGRLSARFNRVLISGGARGIDQAAMRGALDAGGRVAGVMADSLWKAATSRDTTPLASEGNLVLISPNDPDAGFNVGLAMGRNKLIYALADAALVVSTDYQRGGTWAGAVEQLDRLKFCPVYVRKTGAPQDGIERLLGKGAVPWPDPGSQKSFEQALSLRATPVAGAVQSAFDLSDEV